MRKNRTRQLTASQWNEVGLKVSIVQNLILNLLYEDLKNVIHAKSMDAILDAYRRISVVKSDLEDEMFRQGVNFQLRENDIRVFYRNHVSDKGILNFEHLKDGENSENWKFSITDWKSEIIKGDF
jgi:hypothetical protein